MGELLWPDKVSPQNLGCYILCSAAFTGKVVYFGPWRADGHLRDDHHSILVPCCASSLVSITFCGFFSLVVCDWGLLVVLYILVLLQVLSVLEKQSEALMCQVS